VQGQFIKNQKDLVRSMGWNPDAILDVNTGKSVPLDAALSADAAVFSNQGVPMTSEKYGDPLTGSGAIESYPEDGVDFKSPTRRSESGNAPFPGRRGNPYPDMPGSK
jgi:hypothetical protein